ncbi:MAG: hypothetical protein R3D00_27710 [Bacteroidia bacterium]
MLRFLYGKWIYHDLLASVAGEYYDAAVHIVRGNFCQTRLSPGMIWLTALWLRILGISPLSVIIGMAGIYGLFVWQTDRLLRYLGMRSVTNLFHLIFAIYPAFIHASVSPVPDLPIAVGLLAIANYLWQIYHKEKTALADLLGLGTMLGLTFLFSGGVIWVFPVIAGFLIWKYQSALINAMIPLLVSLVIMGGWEISANHCAKRWVWGNDTTGEDFFTGNNAFTPLYRTWWLDTENESNNPYYQRYYHLREEIISLPPEERQAGYFAKAWEHIRSRPDLFLIRTANRIRCFFAFDTLPGKGWTTGFSPLMVVFAGLNTICYTFLSLLAIWGIVGRGSPINKPLRMTMLLMIPAFGIPHFLTFSLPALHLPIMPFLGLFAAVALVRETPRLFSLKGLSKRSRPFVYLMFLSFLYIQVEWIAQMIDRYIGQSL